MKKVLLGLGMALCLLSPAIFAVKDDVKADTTAGRWGVIDMQAVILNVEEGKAARSTLEKEIQEKQKDFTKQREELDKLNNDWKSQAALLSESARLKKQQDFQQKFLALRNAEMTFDQEIKRKEQKATQEIAVKVAKITERMAKEKKLEAVFETNTAGLLYLKDPIDLTKDVVGVYAKEAPALGKVAKKEDSKKVDAKPEEPKKEEKK